jgi:hypothetical protein
VMDETNSNPGEAPVFDFVMGVVVPGVDTVDRIIDTVFHCSTDGAPIYWHSPLTHGTIRCAICENGARVRIT